MTYRMQAFTIAIILSLLTACASEPMKPTNDSYALKVVKAANMNQNLKDTVVPKDTVTSLNSTVFKTSSLLSGYSMPLPGLSGNTMLGIGMLNMLSADEPAARNSIIIWMPQSLVKDGASSKETAFNVFKEAFTKAVKEYGANVGNIYFHPKSGFGTDFGFFEMTNTDASKPCSAKACAITIVFGDTVDVKSNEQLGYLKNYGIFANDPQNPLVLFTPLPNNKYTQIRDYDGFSSDFNQLALTQALSRNLPEWIYFYVAPNRTSVNATEKVKVPMIVHKGSFNYFVKEAE